MYDKAINDWTEGFVKAAAAKGITDPQEVAKPMQSWKKRAIKTGVNLKPWGLWASQATFSALASRPFIAE